MTLVYLDFEQHPGPVAGYVIRPNLYPQKNDTAKWVAIPVHLVDPDKKPVQAHLCDKCQEEKTEIPNPLFPSLWICPRCEDQDYRDAVSIANGH